MSRQVIDEMINIINSPESDETEREMALTTLKEALFPSYDGSEVDGHGDDLLGLELTEAEKACATYREDGAQALSELDAEEARFAERLRSCMQAKGINQTELAEKTGVSQPAISLMLKRSCRPQMRTIRKASASSPRNSGRDNAITAIEWNGPVGDCLSGPFMRLSSHVRGAEHPRCSGGERAKARDL